MGPDQPVGSAPHAPAGPVPPRPPLVSLARNDLLIVLATIAIEWIDYIGSSGTFGPVVEAPVLALFAVAPLLLLARHRHPVAVFAGVLALFALTAVFSPVGHGFPTAVSVALYTVALHRGRAVIAVSGVAVLGVEFLRGVGSDRLLSPGLAVFSDVIAVAMVIVVGTAVRGYRHQVELNRRLLAERAVAQERRHIARELHDVVAHHITTMYLMSGGARSALERDPDASREALVTLEDSARTALSEMRQLLGVLRSDDGPDEAASGPRPGVDEIRRLVAESEVSGLPVGLRITGDRPALPATVGHTLYRLVQEALTNTRKHAGAARARVHLDYRPDSVVVEITDDGGGGDGGPGAGGAHGLVSGGFGLLGMRERVAVHGGSLDAGPREGGGFRVVATLPLAPHPQATDAPA
ncbi:sensor histidine kinase [Streptomyces yaizuensis]|uniref:histidine kinase n=1 Tax=Streptomyces yaizuensis TaxID=2989713 RepID=A0ABQ5NZV1_9ACTN|nr:histidine kinase [Streptomyces sp. YSPA8]GLF95881.1 sensor histidine kinase [Streptomyces sp. YSPA8]